MFFVILRSAMLRFYAAMIDAVISPLCHSQYAAAAAMILALMHCRYAPLLPLLDARCRYAAADADAADADAGCCRACLLLMIARCYAPACRYTTSLRCHAIPRRR